MFYLWSILLLYLSPLFSLPQHGTLWSEATDWVSNEPHIMIFTDGNTYDDDDPLKQYFTAVEQCL